MSKVYRNPPIKKMTGKICILVPLLLLPAVCEGWGPLRRLYFRQEGHDRTWSEAQRHCRAHYTDLVTIRDATHNQHFVNGYGWIGLHRPDSTTWRWSRRDEIANFTIWRDDDPDNGENCAYKHSGDREWKSARCDDHKKSMCYDETLILVKENKTWEEALMHCRALEMDPNRPATDYRNHRYDLVTLLTDDDHNFAREGSQGADSDEVWTGLRYLAGQWLWVGEEQMLFTNIDHCPTHRFCGTLEKTATQRFQTRDCSQKMNFLCYRKF